MTTALVPERLVAARVQIDQREPRVREPDPRGGVNAAAVRSAVSQNRRGLTKPMLIGRHVPVAKENAEDAAHAWSLPHVSRLLYSRHRVAAR